MKCENCGYYYANGTAETPSCHFAEQEWCYGLMTAPCEEPEPEPVHYTVGYADAVFTGDNEGEINHFSTDSWEEAIDLYNRLMDDGVDVWIDDNLYDVTLYKGEWS